VCILVWFRLDLRLRDNPALAAAFRASKAASSTVIPIFCWSPDEEVPWSPGAASRWWFHYSLEGLSQSLSQKGSRLIIRQGKTLSVLQALIRETKATGVYWNRRYEPVVIKRDKHIKEVLRKEGIDVQSFNSHLLFEPWMIQTQAKKPFQVFTPFWKTCLSSQEPESPLSAPSTFPPVSSTIASQSIDSLHLLPTIPWDTQLKEMWAPGEVGALKQADLFLEEALEPYATDRDFPSVKGTSRLSPHLHFGEISPRFLWETLQKLLATRSRKRSIQGVERYLTELGWREFAYHLLYHFPHTTEEPLRPHFKQFPWVQNKKQLKAWQKGLTGYPLVDAGMRELWAVGWMHNRVRMITASFLVKDLLISWQEGAKWFWDTLVDADLASNTLGWQWVSGCGADAAPYFRIFNPSLQAERFDANANYSRCWIPELSTPAYPSPIVNHGEVRIRALTALQTISKKGDIQ